MPAQDKSQTNAFYEIALISGNGQLPKEIYETLVQNGNPPLLLGLKDDVDAWATSKAECMLAWGEVGKMFKTMKAHGVQKVIMAGGVKQRPDFLKLKLDWGAIKTLPQILSFMLGGDNQVLNGVVSIFNKQGFDVVGVHDVAPQLVADEGMISGKKPAKKAELSMEIGFEIARTIGAHDIGQGLVMVNKRAVAVEGAEGTDAMILRIAELKKNGRLSHDAGGILIKCARPNQDLRVDLPSIGPKTIENAAIAGLKGIAIEADRTLILEREKTIALAKEYGIFIRAAVL